MERQESSPFSTLLRHHRMAALLTQEQLAVQAGLSLRGISDLERGVKNRPHSDTVRRLADALGLQGATRAAFESARSHGAARHGTHSGLASDVIHTGPDRTSPAPIVGRGRELALLERHLSRSSAEPQPPLLLLAGEPGIGKSRLLREAARRAGSAGWQVLTGGCQRRSGHAPFAPLLEALEGYITHRAPADLRADLRGCAWLVRLLPELAFGPIEPLPSWTVPAEQERRLMDRAVERFLTNVAGPAGTLLLLDDLQWAGADALILLTTLLRTTTAPPVRVIGTYRDTEAPPHGALTDVLADLAQAGLARQHTLGPLPADDARHLLGTLLAGWPDCAADVRERVVQRAGGVPFYLVSYALGLQERPAEAGVADAVPWDVAQGVRQRLAGLPKTVQEVLGAAAVIGREVPADLLMTIGGHGEREVLEALDAARHAGLLREEDQTYHFAHDLIREVAEADVGSARRVVLHRRIAEALEAEQGEAAVEALADHYGRAGVPEKAVLYLEKAGDRAWAQHANAAAEGYYREAVAGLDRLRQPRAAALMREKLALVLHMAARNEVTLAVLEQAAEAYCAAGDLESEARVTAQIGLVHQNTGQHDEVAPRLRALAQRLEARGPSPGLVKLYAALAGLQIAFGDRREALATTERAVALARTLGDTQLLAEALTQHGSAHVVMGHLGAAERALEEAIPLAEAAGDLVESLPKALWLLSHVCLRYGALDRAARYCERERVITERYGQEVRVVASTALGGLLAYLRGDWARARRDGERALALSQRVGPSWITPFPLTVVGLVCYGEGRWEEAACFFEESVAVGIMGTFSWALFAPSVLAEIDLREGRPERARMRLAPLLAAAERDEADVALLLAPYAWAHLEADDVAAAAAIVNQAISGARAQSDRLTLVDALAMHAMVAIRQRRWTGAEQALEEGLALARSMPYPYAEARLLYLRGLLHSRREEWGPARERLAEAQAIFARLGAQQDRAHVAQALGELSADDGLDGAILSQNAPAPPFETVVSDAQWAQVQALLPPPARTGRRRADDRRTLEAILYQARTGCSWAVLPAEYGDEATAHRRLRQWRAAGLWKRIMAIVQPPPASR